MKVEFAIIFLLLIITAIVTAVFFKSGDSSLAGAIILAFVISFIYMAIGFISTSKAFSKPTTLFYRLFFGGLAVRFLFFLATLFIVYKYTTVSIFAFALSFMMFYVIFQGLEIRYIWRKLEQQKIK